MFDAPSSNGVWQIAFAELANLTVRVIFEVIFLVILIVNRIPSNNVGEDDFILLQFRLHLAPARRSDSLQEAFDKFFLGSISETLASEMFDDYIYIGIIYRSEVYRQSLLIYLWSFNRNTVCVVEIADDATDEVPDSTMTAIHQLIDVLERSKLVMGIILLVIIVPIVEVIAACGNLTVRLSLILPSYFSASLLKMLYHQAIWSSVL